MMLLKTIYHRGGLVSLLSVVSLKVVLANSLPVNQLLSAPSSHVSSYVITLSGGPIWAGGSKVQTFYVQPESERTYIANQQTKTLADAELFIGIQRGLNPRFNGQIGLEIATTSNAGLSGNIWDDAGPEFNNFTYHYQVRHNHIAVKGKLLADIGQLVIPYISGSLGVGFNQAGQYTNTPTIPEAGVQPNFASHTITAFTYTVGIGVQHALTEHSQIGLGYEFADWGQSRLSTAPGQTLGSGLSLNHFYTNGLLFSISYQS